MSIFSKIRLSRKAAKDHKGKAKADNMTEIVPYRHVPTHAAVDALSGAPSTWKLDDRPRIKEQYKRRSQLRMSGGTNYVANASTSSPYGLISHTTSEDGGSTHSHVPPMPGFPKHSGFAAYNSSPSWSDPKEKSSKRRGKLSRSQSFNDSGIGSSIGPSPLASQLASEDVSPDETPVVSSKNSISSRSSDHLEIAIPQKSISILLPPPTVYVDEDKVDELPKKPDTPKEPTPEDLPYVEIPVLVASSQKHRKWGVKRNVTIATM